VLIIHFLFSIELTPHYKYNISKITSRWWKLFL